jgi:heterodisulfide reductase subunit B
VNGKKGLEKEETHLYNVLGWETQSKKGWGECHIKAKKNSNFKREKQQIEKKKKRIKKNRIIT